MTTGSNILGAMDVSRIEGLRAEAAGLTISTIFNHLDTVGVLSDEWRKALKQEDRWRLEAQLKSPGITPAERNGLINNRLSLMGERMASVASSPVPTFGRHPAHSRPQYLGISCDTNTEGSGD